MSIQKTVDPILTSDEMYYVVGCNFVAGVIVRDGIIIGAAPILGRFKGQPLTNLHRWNRILTITKLPGEHTHGTQQD